MTFQFFKLKTHANVIENHINEILSRSLKFIVLVSSFSKHRVSLFFSPQPPAPFTFLWPPAQITCSWPLTMELLFHGPPALKITFSRPLVSKVCHVFFYSFKQNSTCSLFENSFKLKVLCFSSFDEHIQCILIKTRKIIGLIRKLQPIIPRAALLTIYKSFLRPRLDYGNVIYDRVFNESFQNESFCSI